MTREIRLTFLPSSLLQFRVSSNHHNFYHEAVAALSDHVDHLSVTNLHHILAIHLKNHKQGVSKHYMRKKTLSTESRKSVERTRF